MPRSWHPPSAGSSSAPAARPAPSPPTAATARRPSKTTCTTWASARWSSRKGKPGKARQATEHRPAFRRAVKWRTGSEGRISTLKRQYGWDRTRVDGTEGARSWTGYGVLAHNLVKIGALTT